MSCDYNPIPLPAIRRLPVYLRSLELMKQEGVERVTTTDLAERTGFTAVQIRKDIAYASVEGKPKMGYDLQELLSGIEALLGWNNTTDAFLVGVGALGSALLGYSGFSKLGLHAISAAFDTNSALHGKRVHGCTVYPLEKLADLAPRMGIKMGILAVPEEFAQECADLLVASGIRAIWNFAPVILDLPEGVLVQNEDLAAGLAVLSAQMQQLDMVPSLAENS